MANPSIPDAPRLTRRERYNSQAASFNCKTTNANHNSTFVLHVSTSGRQASLSTPGCTYVTRDGRSSEMNAKDAHTLQITSFDVEKVFTVDRLLDCPFRSPNTLNRRWLQRKLRSPPGLSRAHDARFTSCYNPHSATLGTQSQCRPPSDNYGCTREGVD